jgi:hypothetical protein
VHASGLPGWALFCELSLWHDGSLHASGSLDSGMN